MAGRTRFTKRVCKKVAQGLREELGDRFHVGEEEPPFDGWSGKPDIFIDAEKRHKKSIVIIEIEHWSGTPQAKKNIEQAIEWAVDHPSSGVAYINLVNTGGNVDPAALNVAGQRGPVNWMYRQAQYTHDKDDKDSVTAKIVAEIFAPAVHRTVREAIDFAFKYRKSAPLAAPPQEESAASNGRTGRATRWKIRREKDDSERDTWVIYADGEECGNFMTEKKARARLEKLQESERRAAVAEPVREIPAKASRTAASTPPTRRGRSPKADASPGPDQAWLDEVAQIAADFTPGRKGECSVYLALLKIDGKYGIYVGETGIGAQERYRKHKADHKAGRGYVREFGVGLLEEPVAHLQALSRDRAKAIEGKLFRRLERAGFMVKGGH